VRLGFGGGDEPSREAATSKTWFPPEVLKLAAVAPGASTDTGTTEAAARGCSQTVHFTYDFQARALYERNGYELVGRVEDFPSGTDVLWYRKRLVDGQPEVT
jgi:hypothetical protein